MRIRSNLACRLAGGVAAVAAGAALALAMGSMAQAKNEYKYWNSLSNPLVVSHYGSWAKGYGQWRVTDGSNGTRSYLDARMWYYNADNHKKYADLETMSNSGNCWGTQYLSCDYAYYSWAYDDTYHSNYTGKSWLYANTSVDPRGNFARAGVSVCLDVPSRWDKCSGQTLTGGTEY